MEGMAGKVFSGQVHPAELAGRLAREADFARFDHDTGPATANRYAVSMNPRDVHLDLGELSAVLTSEVLAHTVDEGLRLEGPLRVEVQTDETVAPGKVSVHVEVIPGEIEPWSRLIGADTTLGIGHNRTSIGRGEAVDVVIDEPTVSRRHALVWRHAGRTWIRDLGSSNGTTVDGQSVGVDPIPLVSGSVVSFGESSHRYVEN